MINRLSKNHIGEIVIIPFILIVHTQSIAISSDFNSDNKVDLDDFFQFADAFGTSITRFDLNGDRTIDFNDFFLFADAFGKPVIRTNQISSPPVLKIEKQVETNLEQIVELGDGAKLIAEADAFSNDTEIVIQSFNESGNLPLPEGMSRIGNIYQFDIGESVLIRPVTILIPYDERLVPAGFDEENVVAATYDGNKWDALSGDVNISDNIVAVQVSHFSFFSTWLDFGNKIPKIEQVIATPTHYSNIIELAGFKEDLIFEARVLDANGLGDIKEVKIRLSITGEINVWTTRLAEGILPYPFPLDVLPSEFIDLQMKDDGSSNSGDRRAGDGIYSTKLKLTNLSSTNLSFLITEIKATVFAQDSDNQVGKPVSLVVHVYRYPAPSVILETPENNAIISHPSEFSFRIMDFTRFWIDYSNGIYNIVVDENSDPWSSWWKVIDYKNKIPESGSLYYLVDSDELRESGTYYWGVIISKNAELGDGDDLKSAVYRFSIVENSPPNLPSHLSPLNHAIEQPLIVILSWVGGDPDIDDTVTYDLYFGTDSTPDEGELVSRRQSTTNYTTYTLSPNVQYYWKIVAKDSHGDSREGTIWDFRTQSSNSPPYTPSNPSPSHLATSIPLNITLSWIGRDPDANDMVTYDVYFGTASTLGERDLVSRGQSRTSYTTGTLNTNTQYYWKIMVRDNHGAYTEGLTWNFRTLAPVANSYEGLKFYEVLDKIKELAATNAPQAFQDCNAVFQSRLKDDCIANVAAASLDKSYCGGIENARIKDECFSNVAVMRRESPICREIEDEGTRDLCYLTFAIDYNDYSVCAYVMNQQFREMCDTLRRFNTLVVDPNNDRNESK